MGATVVAIRTYPAASGPVAVTEVMRDGTRMVPHILHPGQEIIVHVSRAQHLEVVPAEHVELDWS